LEQIRIVLVGMPRMLREIVREIVTTQLDMSVVAETTDPAALLRLLRRKDAQLVVAGADDLQGADVERLLDAHPRLKLLSIRDDGRQILLYELRPRKVALGELAPSTLAAAIRAVSSRRPLRFDHD
jgi:DNA-binding NarL/FixJ family response regulator